ncbi:MFS transporter [Pseudobacteroides cellulosolvens]|uniref:Major facilitator superfamily MFS_1 n=1 Tax=Pseudobacteroides cellulosolvens ATCC 35603 = DSM 2933 TaxID=398512 RepID=A0A0L6JHZ2_9FIRM|nr:MFS transporter [Pseudobacteroides cellulosolvens]KNY25344.1 major facilitator superfamily MFS_1 [Pseudobacteroides cellulosolvens ATCC 35603 = DSM 2933]
MDMKRRIMKKLIRSIPILSILAIVLLIQVLVGMGEAVRTYSEYYFDRIYADGESLKNSIESILNAGTPLKYADVDTLANLLDKEPAGITKIEIWDGNDIVYPKSEEETYKKVIYEKFLEVTEIGGLKRDKNKTDSKPLEILYRVQKSLLNYKVDIPLKNKIDQEQSGTISIIISKKVISQKIAYYFRIVYTFFIVAIMMYVIFLLKTEHKWKHRWKMWVTSSFCIAFMMMMGLIIFTLINIYLDGITGKTYGVTNSLTHRLKSACELGLDLEKFTNDIDNMFSKCISSNSEIRRILLEKNGKIVSSIDKETKGSTLDSQTQLLKTDYINTYGDIICSEHSSYKINIYVYKNAIYKKLIRNIKNFLVLLIALFFVAALFINLIISLRQKVEEEDNNLIENISDYSDYKINLIKPIYFIAAFGEGCITSFFPNYVNERAAGINGAASLIITLYSIIFTLSLYPAAKVVSRKGEKSILCLGIAIYSFSMLILVIDIHWQLIFVSRLLAAIGQAVIFAGVQSYILRNTGEGQKTKSSAIIVFGFNGGMIAGTSLGALGLNYLGKSGVFLGIVVVSLPLIIYSILLLPKKENDTNNLKKEKSMQKRHWIETLKIVILDIGFLKSVFLVGISTKMILSGFVTFALPLAILSGYKKDDIGQIIMIYYAGVLLSSIYSSKLSDKLGKTRNILFFGMLGSGAGLALIGANSNLSQIEFPYFLIAGVALLGVAHGFINAPINTHIINTNAALKIGQMSIASIYKMLERIGHMAGPIVFSQIIYLNKKTPLAFVYVGVVVIVFGLLFKIGLKSEEVYK